MNADVERKLRSINPRDRLMAARYLAANAQANDVRFIEQVLAVETVAWVASALRRALQRARPEIVDLASREPTELSPEQTAQIYSEALEATATQIIHEIEPILGALRLSAECEISSFETSETKRGLDRMGALVEALVRLRSAASPPKIEEFMLDECVFQWVEEESSGKNVRVLRAGPKDTMVEGDKDLVKLCFINGIRNAIDATLALPSDVEQRREITINWGVTDVDIWIVIVDSGIGFRGNISRAFEIGSTTKAGHLGMGLATAQQAMTSLSGSVNLVPEDRGVRFEMRWPRVAS